jgi:hypothetical protein
MEWDWNWSNADESAQGHLCSDSLKVYNAGPIREHSFWNCEAIKYGFQWTLFL